MFSLSTVSKGCILSLWTKRRRGGKSSPVRRILHAGAIAGLFIAGVGAVLGPANDTRADGAPEPAIETAASEAAINPAIAEVVTSGPANISFATDDSATVAAAESVASAEPETPVAEETASAQDVTRSDPTETAPIAENPETQVAMLADVAPAEREVDNLQSLTVRSGDTLMNLLIKAGVPSDQGHAAIQALRKVYNPRSILPGQKITVTTRSDEAEGAEALLHKVALRTDIERDVVVRRHDDGQFRASEVKHELRTELVRSTGTIDSSLYVAGRNAGMPPSILIDLMRIYSWDVDFQRDIQPGDGFDIVFERLTTESGEKVRDGEIVYAELQLGGSIRKFYRFVDEHGDSGYFDENGQSARKPLLRTPVDGARLTSRYGRRRHPVLRYTRMHRGVDFAAAPGTPVYAAGNGRIVYRGRKGAFGKYIKIRHNSQYHTAYAHLRSFRRGVTTGSRVKQGQIIGYVGSTGTATGPHLHFEVLVGGRQVNPLRVRLPSGRQLKGKQLVAFQAMRGALTQRMAKLRTEGIKVSSN
jgi:murein DD-endopeptidase MepM/ murein hydrolase activator NlpD